MSGMGRSGGLRSKAEGDGSYSRNVVRRLCVVCSVETEWLNRLSAIFRVIKPSKPKL